jgi:hypothetical protein
MPRVRYIGDDPDGVSLEIAGEQPIHVVKGGEAEVSAAIRDELAARDDWTAVKERSAPKSDKDEEE